MPLSERDKWKLIRGFDNGMDFEEASLKRKPENNVIKDGNNKKALKSVENGENSIHQLTNGGNDPANFQLPDDALSNQNKTRNNKSESNTTKAPELHSNNNKGPFGVWMRKVRKDDIELNQYKIGSILFLN